MTADKTYLLFVFRSTFSMSYPGQVRGLHSPRGPTALPGPPITLPTSRRSPSLTPLRIATGIFALALSLGFFYLLTLTLRLQARLEANDAADTSLSRSLTSQGNGGGVSSPPSPALHSISNPGLQPSVPSQPCPSCPACTASSSGTVPAQSNPGGSSTGGLSPSTITTSSSSNTTATASRPGLRRLLSDIELDDLFRVRSELDAAAFGTTGDTSLLPLLVRVYGEHKWRRGFGADGAGGFMDVGANIGDVSEEILRTFGGQGRVQHHHYLAPDLSDPEHPAPGSNEKVPFLLALEGSPGTRALLTRRATAGAWSACNARILGIAAGNTTAGSAGGVNATFCSHMAGSEKSGLAGEGASGATTDGERVCIQVPSDSITGVLNKEVGEKARIFLLKIVSGGEGWGWGGWEGWGGPALLLKWGEGFALSISPPFSFFLSSFLSYTHIYTHTHTLTRTQ